MSSIIFMWIKRKSRAEFYLYITLCVHFKLGCTFYFLLDIYHFVPGGGTLVPHNPVQPGASTPDDLLGQCTAGAIKKNRDYFHYRLISSMFPWAIDYLFRLFKKKQQIKNNSYHTFTLTPLYMSYFLSNEQSTPIYI